MIDKLVHIENVGRFLSCKPSGDVAFRTLNLIYALNGLGKTTLCDVFRSLSSGDSRIILGRKTLNSAQPQIVDFRLSNGKHARFDNEKWNISIPEIIIFDDTFINDNIFSGHMIDKNHRKNLCQVIIGNKGVQLAKRYNSLLLTNKVLLSEKKRIEDDLSKTIKRTITIDQFISLENDTDITSKISEASTNLAAIQRKKEIKAKNLYTLLPIPSLPDDFLSILSTTIEGLSVTAQQKIEAHFKKHNMEDGGAKWIRQGINFTANDTCPFCGLDLSKSDLPSLYARFFSEAYDDHIASIDLLRENVTSLLNTTETNKIFLKNQSLFEFWRVFNTPKLPEIDFDNEITTPVSSLLSAALELVEEKSRSPLSSINPSAMFNKSIAPHQTATRLLNEYNDAIIKANACLSDIKDKASTGDITQAENTLSLLKLSQARFTPETAQCCNRHTRINNTKLRMEESRKSVMTAIELYQKTIFSTHEKRINALLQNFGACFSIGKFSGSFSGQEHNSTFQIIIRDTPINPTKNAIDQPCLRNTLSEGDRRALALALFISIIEHHPTPQQLAVIFDDPFSSLDRFRRGYTKELITNLMDRAGMVFVFSHDIHFLGGVCENKERKTWKSLKIISQGANSLISEFDIEKEASDEHEQRILRIEHFIDTDEGDPEKIESDLRRVVEGHIRRLFPLQTKKHKNVGSILKAIRNAGSTDPLSKLKPALLDIQDINDNYKDCHHSSPECDAVPLDEIQLKAYCKRALSFVSNAWL